jgi:CubicO group peptidase (beta-lactamase class C family)
MKHRIALFLLVTALFLVTCHKFDDPSVNYTYRIPSAGNELMISSLTSEGMDSSLIIQMTDKIIREEFKRIDGLLILRNNKLVYEEYFHGYSESVPHNIFSAAKSITSILTGIAIDKGLIESVDAPILPLLPEYTSYTNPDPRKSEITIRHLLNMSSGLDCDDWYADTETNMDQSSDWVKFTLDLQQVHDPGTNGLYCTGGVVTLGQIIENQSGMRLDQFADQNLFKPLGITNYKWKTSGDGRISGGGGELYLRPRDMARIGLTMLNNGVWNGNQVVPEDWVLQSIQNVITLPGPYTGYGFLWWKQTFTKNDSPVNIFFASGNGGQDIFVIPSEQMVLIFTQGNQDTSLGIQDIDMIQNYILPAIQ